MKRKPFLNAEDAKVAQKTQKKTAKFGFLFCALCEFFAPSAFKEIVVCVDVNVNVNPELSAIF